ncbi:hypothetical protein LB553_01280 [Mesorhizobium sp. CA8]|uniref:hypothetical protein n=1 Tax=Mesorhizobium sp. CA8 TaxID=2876637 RepID=UPI001CCCAB4B|nr:hypothetical protein [Mesorhizobium sp. CA8]MBZ9759519.1 hypothetical protein [Mesorhizobium sp. CA8]
MASEMPEDIRTAARQFASDFDQWLKAGNSFGHLSEHAVDGLADTIAQALLSNELDPEIGFPSDELLRRVHLDVETRGRKNPEFAVSVHHRNIVLSAVAHALRKRDCSWGEWREACGWPRGSEDCECYRPGDCDGSCTHPPSRCETNLVGGMGECLSCGAAQGEHCKGEHCKGEHCKGEIR